MTFGIYFLKSLLIYCPCRSLSVFMAGCCAVLCAVVKQGLHKVALKSLEAYCDALVTHGPYLSALEMHQSAFIKWTGWTLAMTMSWWQHHKHCHSYYYYYYYHGKALYIFMLLYFTGSFTAVEECSFSHRQSTTVQHGAQFYLSAIWIRKPQLRKLLTETLCNVKTTVWSGRIFCIRCYLLGVCIWVIVFHFTYVTLYLYVCWCHGLRLPDLNKETTYLLIVSVTRQLLHTSFSVRLRMLWIFIATLELDSDLNF